MRWRTRPAGTVATMLVLAVPALGCSFGDTFPSSCGYGQDELVDTADLVADYAGTHGGTLTLHADATFIAADIPVQDGVKLSGTGTWSLRPAPSPADIEAGTMVLTFTGAAGATTTWTRLKPEAEEPFGRNLAYPYGENGDCDIRELVRS